jgi:hypothetical protein
VPSTHFGHHFVGARGRTDPFELVGCDGHAKARSTDQDASLGIARRDKFGYRHGVVWIVDRLIALGSKVGDLVTIGAQQRYQFAFDLITAVITPYSNSHGHFSAIG